MTPSPWRHGPALASLATACWLTGAAAAQTGPPTAQAPVQQDPEKHPQEDAQGAQDAAQDAPQDAPVDPPQDASADAPQDVPQDAGPQAPAAAGITAGGEAAMDPSLDSVAPASGTAEPSERGAPSDPADAYGDEALPEMTAADLAELGFDSDGTEAALDTDFHINGFVDFSVHTTFGSDAWRALGQRHLSFYIGNFNLYLSKRISESVRTFAEVRLTYLPNGSRDFYALDGSLTDTTAVDYAALDTPLRTGSIEIERVYLEWSPHPLIKLRVGQFLTPYGIWNVDHGTPTVIPVTRPAIVSQELFPERQTGFELSGRTRVGADHSLGYHLTLSNGLGPASEYRDLDNNKAVGGRAFWTYEGLGNLQLGVSGFYGLDTSARETVGLGGNGDLDLTFSEVVDRQSRLLSMAADVRWDYDSLLLQAEFISQQRAFTSAGRGGGLHPFLGRWLAPKDNHSLGFYFLAGYRFEWLGVMPYAMVETIDFLTRDFLASQSRGLTLGLNIRPIDAVVIKVEYARAELPNGFLITEDPLNTARAQLAWAF